MLERVRREFRSYHVITLSELLKVFPDFDTHNLVRWQRKGYITKLRNRHYLLNDSSLDRNEADLFSIANKLYRPSYVSLESALSFYGLIPEGVFRIQSITTLKTNAFNTPVGGFDYRSIKPQCYFGYRLAPLRNGHYLIAELEKAMLDFLYFRHDICDRESLDALRWNQAVLSTVNHERFEAYLELFNSPALKERSDLLKPYFNAQH